MFEYVVKYDYGETKYTNLYLALYQSLSIFLHENYTNFIEINVYLNTEQNLKYPVLCRSYKLYNNMTIKLHNQKYNLHDVFDLNSFNQSVDYVITQTPLNELYYESFLYILKNQTQKENKKNEEKNEPNIDVNKIREMINELEQTKLMTDESIVKIKEEIKENNETVTKFQEEYNDEIVAFKRAKTKYENEKSQFISERDVTFCGLLNSNNDIPDIFKNKFYIYLFLGGYNHNKKLVRNSLLHDENSFELFKLIYNYINSDKDLDEIDEKDENTIVDFINFLPDDFKFYDETIVPKNKYEKIFNEC